MIIFQVTLLIWLLVVKAMECLALSEHRFRDEKPVRTRQMYTYQIET